MNAYESSAAHETATKFGRPPADNHGMGISFLRRSSTHRRVETLIRGGVGVRECAWDADDLDDDHGRRELTDRILFWIRRAMGEMRRPYGIDHVAVALACRDEHGKVLCSSSLGVIRPGSFYGADGVERIAGFLEDVDRVSGGEP